MTFSEEYFRPSHMQQSPRPQRVYILRGVQRRCVWTVWRLGLAAWLACVAAAAVAHAMRPPDALRRRPDTERTCLAVGPTQITPPHQTRQNSPVCVVSGVSLVSQTLLLVFRPHRMHRVNAAYCSRRHTFRGLCGLVCLMVSPAKTHEPIEVAFEV